MTEHAKTPPTPVRYEALGVRITEDDGGLWVQVGEATPYWIGPRARAALAAFEACPRGTVTDDEHDRDHMMICRKCGKGLNARDVLYGEKPCPGAREMAFSDPHDGEQYLEGKP